MIFQPPTNQPYTLPSQQTIKSRVQSKLEDARKAAEGTHALLGGESALLSEAQLAAVHEELDRREAEKEEGERSADHGGRRRPPPRVTGAHLLAAAERARAEVIQVIGRTFTLYRENPDLKRGELPPWRG